MLVDQLPLSSRSRDALKRLGFQELFPPQEKAVEAGLLEGKGLVVAAPTGSGKSLIALMAALRAVEGGGRALYLAPLRSLVYERAHEWREAIGFLGGRVAVATGDYDRVEPWLSEADAALVTYEKLDSLLRHGADWVYDVDVVVVDEAHYIGDEERGPVLETSLARLLHRSTGIQVVAMSATVPNAGELARWLGAGLVECNWRPVRLREGVYAQGRILWSDGGEDAVERVTGHPSLDTALDAVGEGGQSLVFVQSRRKAVDLAEKLAGNRRAAEILVEAGETPGDEQLKALYEHREHESINRQLARLLAKGIGFHHAGLASYQRELVETLFRRRLVRVLVATPTLAAGVNLPARRVVVDSVYRYSGGSNRPISVSEYKQLAGRAGRPGLDPVGEAVIVARSLGAGLEYMEAYIRGSPEPVYSKLVSERRLRSQVLAVAVSEAGARVEDIVAVFGKTFYASVYGSPGSVIKRILRELAGKGFLEVSGDRVEPTPLGRRTAELYIDPETAGRMVRASRGLELYWSERTALLVALWNSDSQLLRVPRGEQLRYEAEAEELLAMLGFTGLEAYDIAVAARALYTAEVVGEWINEEPEDTILQRHGIGPGDLRAVVSVAEWLLYAFSEVARLSDAAPVADRLERLRERVRHGVREELLGIVKLPGIGRVRARILFNAGYRTPESIAGLSPERLAALVRGLGVKGASRVVEAAAAARPGEHRAPRGGRGRRSLFDYIGGG